MVKSEYDFTIIKRFIQETESNPFVKKYFHGNPFPTNIKDLGTGLYSYVVDIDKELLICALIVKKYSKQIGEFLRMKQTFENSILLGNYKQATDCLQTVEANFGISLWLIEHKFILEELSGGLKSNLEYLNYINNNSDEAFVTSFASYFSLKAEKRTSIGTYNLKVNVFTKDFAKHIKDYVTFKVNYFEGILDFTELNEIISFESLFSIVDRYLTLVKICQLITIKDSFIANRTTVKRIITDLVSAVEDPLLSNLSRAYQINEIIKLKPADIDVLNLYESYTLGEYHTAIEQCKKILMETPLEFSVIEVYAKSLLHLEEYRQNANPIGISNDDTSLINQILADLFHIIQRSENSTLAYANLLKKIFIYQNFSCAAQQYCYLCSIATDVKVVFFEKLRYLNSSLANPLGFNLYSEREQKIQYLKSFSSAGDLTVVKLLDVFIGSQSTIELERIDALSIPWYRKLYYKGLAYVRLNDKLYAVKCFEAIIEKEIESLALYEETVLELLKCYALEDSFDKFISLYVKTSIKNTELTTRVHVDDVIKKIKTTKFKVVKELIFLPIFLKMTGQNSHLLNISIRKLLSFYNKARIKELEIEINADNKVYFLYLLDKVCTTEVIKYFTYHIGTKSVLNERLDICQILLRVNLENKEVYTQEISTIIQNLAILEAIREIDESKIYVDVKGLITNELKDTKNNFQRYIEISDLFKHVSLIFIDLDNNKNILINIPVGDVSEKDMKKARAAEDIKFELFKELFYEIRNEFLFNNKYGLDSYLSTRIRHGTLLGQIRSQFQEQFLITQKDKESQEYYENEYWKTGVYSQENINTPVQFFLGEFSRKVDEITNGLKNSLIQIRVDKSGSGLFDYSYLEVDLRLLYTLQFKSIREFESFLQGVFAELWKQTSINLEIIRNHISTVIKSAYIECLNELELNLLRIKGETKENPNIFTNILHCKTSIDYELDKIADWFQIRQTKVSDFNISKPIDTSIEITNKISSNVKLGPSTKEIFSSSAIRGEFFISFFDLTTIFFDNIDKYCELQSEKLNLEIFAVEEQNLLTIKIANNLSPDIDIKSLKSKFESKMIELNKTNWDMDQIKKEEGTGFYKAKKILTSDLQCDNNFFTVTINEKDFVEVKIAIHLNNIKA